MRKYLIAMTALAFITTTQANATVCEGSCKPTPIGKTSNNSTGPWIIFACAGGIIAAAIVANARENRELTAQEAWTCGLMYWPVAR